MLRAARDRRRLSARRDYFLIYFLGRTGLRITEFLSLRVGDLSLDTDPPFVRVVSLKQRGRKAQDQVLLEAKVARRAGVYIRRSLARQLGRAATRTDYVMPGSRGRGRMSVRNASYLLHEYVRRARLRPGINLHSLRHYRTTDLYLTTGNLEFTRQQIRHRHLSTTQIYLHVDPDLERKYLALLGGKRRPKKRR